MDATTPPLPPPRARKATTHIAKYLPRAATFTALPFSPSHEPKPHPSRAFSGPIHLIPTEPRRNSIGAEPTSPKVTCMGQVKRRHKTKGGDRTAVGSFLSRLFGRKKKPVAVTAPPAGEMKRFASGRASSNHVAPMAVEGEGVAAPAAASGGGGEGKKEVNLWKRRAMATPLKPLSVH